MPAKGLGDKGGGRPSIAVVPVRTQAVYTRIGGTDSTIEAKQSRSGSHSKIRRVERRYA